MVIVDDMPFHHHINSSIIQDTLILYSIINLMYLDNYSSKNIKSIDIKQRCI